MSAILTSFSTQNDPFRYFFLRATDETLHWPGWQWSVWHRSAQARPWEDGLLWPCSASMSGDVSGAGFIVSQDASNNRKWGCPTANTDIVAGGQTQLMLRGVTRDSTGTELGSCVVQAFRTSDDAFAGECVSDAGGYFAVPSKYGAVAHYLVCYKAGSPNVAGTSVNTLIPS